MHYLDSMNLLSRLFVSIAAFALSGCATNNVTRFYQDLSGQRNNAARFIPNDGPMQIVQSSNLEDESLFLLRSGYVQIGVSSFSGPSPVTEAEIREHGAKCGAAIALYTFAHEGSSQSTLAIPQFNPGTTSTTYASGTLYGSGGQSTRFSGVGTTTSSGTVTTNYIPITVNRYGSTVIFWRKTTPPILGVQVVDLPNHLRVSLKRNAGAYVQMVVNDSPAFVANLVPGDVMIAINDEPVNHGADVPALVDRHAGTRVVVRIIRDGAELTMPVTLNSPNK
jgi:hypothetical protein